MSLGLALWRARCGEEEEKRNQVLALNSFYGCAAV